MRLDLDQLDVLNFKSIQKLQLNLKGYGPGLHFFRGHNETSNKRLGSNGAGKSTIFDAIAWVLFGVTARGLRTPDVKPWNGETPTRVKLCFQLDGKVHWLMRQTNPNKLVLDDEPVTQEEIEALIGCGPKLAFITFLLGQGEDLYLDMSPADKLQVFNDALGLERWETRSAKAAAEAKGLERDLDTIRTKFAMRDDELAGAKKIHKDLTSRSAEWAELNKKRVTEMEDERAELEKLLVPAEKRLATAQLELDGAGTELKALRRDMEPLEKALRDAERAVTQAEGNLRALERDRDRLNRELDKLAGAETCPTCGQSIAGPEGLDQHRKELSAEIDTVEKALKKGVPKTLTDAVVKATKALSRAREHAESFAEREEKAQSTVNVQLPLVTEARTKVRSLATQIKTAREAINPYRDQVTAQKRRVDAIEDELDELDAARKTAEKALVNVQYWVKGFKDVRLNLLSDLLGELETAANDMMPDIGLEGWELRFDIERETQAGTIKRGLNVTVLSPANDKAVRWENWSGGEGQRLRVIGALALSDTLLNEAGVQPNLEVLDEPSQHISVEGIRDFAPFLAGRARGLGRRVFWVDQAAVESNHFSSVTNIRKTKAGTTID